VNQFQLANLFLLFRKLPEMADIGVKYDQNVATQGMAEGNVEILKEVHDPGRGGTKVRP
jgi:hypothetical protein